MLPCEMVLAKVLSTFGYAGFVLYNGLDREIYQEGFCLPCVLW